MTYETAQAFRMALEQRLLNPSKETGQSRSPPTPGPLRARSSLASRLPSPGRWVLKGGMALEVRLRDDARLTKDIDLGLRDDVTGARS